jgi:hypothetical protein
MVHLHDRVVDAKRAQGPQEVFDGLDRDRLTHQTGLILLHPAEMRDRGRDFEAIQVCPLKPNTVIGRRRLQGKRDFVTGMKTDSGAGGGSS